MSASPFIKVVNGERVAVFRLPPVRPEVWEIWKRRTERRLERIERAMGRIMAARQVCDRVDLDGETLAARLKQPDVAGALIRLLFGPSDTDRDG